MAASGTGPHAAGGRAYRIRRSGRTALRKTNIHDAAAKSAGNAPTKRKRTNTPLVAAGRRTAMAALTSRRQHAGSAKPRQQRADSRTVLLARSLSGPQRTVQPPADGLGGV